MISKDGFETITATELVDLDFPYQGYLVENILGKGLYILSGAPKIGKSWLVLWLADRVSRGEKVWNFKTEKCDVLYISPEDTLQRMQERLDSICDNNIGSIAVTTKTKCIGDGFEDDLRNYLSNSIATRFVIIDTLQCIRKATSNYSYADDYEIMQKLKSIADEYGITILLVHHNSKKQYEDPLYTISGTSGIAGAVDGTLVLSRLRRGDPEANLFITGRDMADINLSIVFNRTAKMWELMAVTGDDCDDGSGMLLQSVSDLISKNTTWTGTSTELAAQLGIQMEPNVLSRKLVAHKSKLIQDYNILIERERSASERIIKLSVIRDRNSLYAKKSECKDPKLVGKPLPENLIKILKKG